MLFRHAGQILQGGYPEQQLLDTIQISYDVTRVVLKYTCLVPPMLYALRVENAAAATIFADASLLPFLLSFTIFSKRSAVERGDGRLFFVPGTACGGALAGRCQINLSGSKGSPKRGARSHGRDCMPPFACHLGSEDSQRRSRDEMAL